MQINELTENLSKYDYLKVWVTDASIHVINFNTNKELILLKQPIGKVWGVIEERETGKMLYILKPQFDKALNHLYRIANEIKDKK